MSYLTVRIYPHHNLADVLAFKTKKAAEWWVKNTRDFLASGIGSKQVTIEYIGKYPLPSGIYIGEEPRVERTFRDTKEVKEHGEAQATRSSVGQKG